MAASMEEKNTHLVSFVMASFLFFLTNVTLHFCPTSCLPCLLEEFSPTRIISRVEDGCVLVLFARNHEVNLKLRALAVELDDILLTESGIDFGTSDVILDENFRWPNGQSLRWLSINPQTHLKNKDDGSLLVFPKRKVDRTCLVASQVKVNPKAELFTGDYTMNNVLEWVNTKCNTFISSSGGLSYAGMHRDSILKNLFSVSHISNFTMLNFNQHYETRNTCTDDCFQQRSDICLSEEHSCKIWKEKCLQNAEDICTVHTPESTFATVYTKSTLNVKVFDKNRKSDSPSFGQIPQCERLSTPPTKSEFFYNYLTTSKPVILEGAVTHWKAFYKWTMEFLRQHYGKKDVHIKLAPDGVFEGVDNSSNWEDHDTFTIPQGVFNKLPFPDLVVVRPATINVKFADFLDMIGNASLTNRSNSSKPRVSAYLEYSSIPNYLPELQRDIEEFSFTQDLLKLRHLNIWLSDGNTLGKLHFDPFDNFLCQIRGQKQLILFEPHDNTKMYEGHIPEAKLGYNPATGKFRRKKLLDSTAMVMAPVDILKPDFKRFPAFAETRPLNCTINEGDVLFMPAFWWHEVQSFPNFTEGRNLAVNFWYEPFLTKEFPCAHCKLDVNPEYRHLLRTSHLVSNFTEFF